jgi:hypothetical protein
VKQSNSYGANAVFVRFSYPTACFCNGKIPNYQKGVHHMTDNTNEETEQPMIQTNSVRRRFKIVAAGLGVGVGAALAYLISKVLRAGPRVGADRAVPENVVDDRGTNQAQAATILRKLRDRAFEASDEKLALALGRPIEEVAAWNAGQEVIDDDVVMKARGIAMHRGVHLE